MDLARRAVTAAVLRVGVAPLRNRGLDVFLSDHVVHAMVETLLEGGVDVLIEKPMTTNLEEADALISFADSKGLIIQVGHLERFNPAVIALKDIVHTPMFIEAHRLSIFKDRSTPQQSPQQLHMNVTPFRTLSAVCASPAALASASTVSPYGAGSPRPGRWSRSELAARARSSVGRGWRRHPGPTGKRRRGSRPGWAA